ncbi:glutathione peroxidase [Thioclava sp. 15-R06ZXC-3]|uniref:Glutathione peroxidase n=1 Tax=Thioclava arctica TaxID=3238301 RepID=A0ABV3TFJ3_9RHOB
MIARCVAGLMAFALMTSLAVASPDVPPDIRFDLIEGGQMRLADYKGKVVLVVNTASKCGYAGQFSELQALADRYGDKGLVVLTVPSNDFKQELKSGEEAKRYCAMTFGAELPMAQITHVSGGQAHPFYAWLRAEKGFEPNWNFNKVLLGRDGAVIETFRAGAAPLSSKITGSIEAALSQAM